MKEMSTAETHFGRTSRFFQGPPAVRVRGLKHFYGKGEARSQVLFDCNLEVMPGEIVIMTGPSGSGKTTLLTLMGGLRTIQEGSVEILGQEMHGLGEAELVAVRRRIGFIFQAHNLFESLTAHQTVFMALELHRHTREEMNQRAVEMLTALGLGHRIYYKPGALSGGQKQRVAIARALANRPKLILADEPTAALDEKSGRDVVNLLQQLAREEKCTSFIVTHDNRILNAADRIVNMVGGRIVSNVLVEESVAICEFLTASQVFKGFSPEAISGVAEKMVKESFHAGTVIVRQGDEADKFYLIRKGTVDVSIAADGATPQVVRTLTEGDFFGERALLTGERRSATVTARDEVQAYTLGKADFTAAVAAVSSFRDQLRKAYFGRQ
jgi:putative ABC transport system ATP-binding protein